MRLQNANRDGLSSLIWSRTKSGNTAAAEPQTLTQPMLTAHPTASPRKETWRGMQLSDNSVKKQNNTGLRNQNSPFQFWVLKRFNFSKLKTFLVKYQGYIRRAGCTSISFLCVCFTKSTEWKGTTWAKNYDPGKNENTHQWNPSAWQ